MIRQVSQMILCQVFLAVANCQLADTALLLICPVTASNNKYATEVMDHAAHVGFLFLVSSKLTYEFQNNRKSSTGTNSPNAGARNVDVAPTSSRRSAPNLSSMMKGGDNDVNNIQGAQYRDSLFIGETF